MVITDTNNCSETIEVDANYIYPPALPSWSDSVITLGDPLSFGYVNEPFHIYYWYDEDGNQCQDCETFIFPNDDNVFNLIVTDELGCHVDTFKFQVDVLAELLFYMPNAFSPNGDGVNDLLFPQITRAQESDYEFSVWNRGGQLVYQTTDINGKWSGSGLNSSYYADTEVFIWQVKVRDLKAKLNQFVGSVTLIR